jgi:hypothetical protein
MEKKQTAVEFYRTELSALVSMKESKFQNENEIFEQAKQIEKQQIVEAYCKAGLDIAHNDSIKESGLAQEYYNETYGGQDEH